MLSSILGIGTRKAANAKWATRCWTDFSIVDPPRTKTPSRAVNGIDEDGTRLVVKYDGGRVVRNTVQPPRVKWEQHDRSLRSEHDRYKHDMYLH